MGRYYLQESDIAYSTGAHVRWQGDHWELARLGEFDDTYYYGCLVEHDDSLRPYIIQGGEEDGGL